MIDRACEANGVELLFIDGKRIGSTLASYCRAVGDVESGEERDLTFHVVGRTRESHEHDDESHVYDVPAVPPPIALHEVNERERGPLTLDHRRRQLVETLGQPHQVIHRAGGLASLAQPGKTGIDARLPALELTFERPRIELEPAAARAPLRPRAP